MEVHAALLLVHCFFTQITHAQHTVHTLFFCRLDTHTVFSRATCSFSQRAAHSLLLHIENTVFVILGTHQGRSARYITQPRHFLSTRVAAGESHHSIGPKPLLVARLWCDKVDSRFCNKNNRVHYYLTISTMSRNAIKELNIQINSWLERASL